MTFKDAEPAFERLTQALQDVRLDDSQTLEEYIAERTADEPLLIRDRLRDEHLGLGPLQPLVDDPNVTEILINGPNSLWFEKNGQFFCHSDQFFSPLTYRNFYHRICAEAKIVTNYNIPKADGRWRDFRLCVVQSPIVKTEYQMSFRRQQPHAWSLQAFETLGWAKPEEINHLRSAIRDKQNILVVGATGSGKTSVLNACLKEIADNERVVILEDTDELAVPNLLSTKLLTRQDTQKILADISLSDLVRLALRLRPDRVIMGEVRGEEAKDLLMAFASGHRGGFGTLHADSARQALLRLEMLIQLGAPQWSIQAVRQLILLSLQMILVVRMTNGRRHFDSLWRLTSLESFGFTLEPIAQALQSI